MNLKDRVRNLELQADVEKNPLLVFNKWQQDGIVPTDPETREALAAMQYLIYSESYSAVDWDPLPEVVEYYQQEEQLRLDQFRQSYCTQNYGDCDECSLSTDGRDCKDREIGQDTDQHWCELTGEWRVRTRKRYLGKYYEPEE